MPRRTDAELLEAFDRLPEKGKHYIKLLQEELLDLRARVTALEARSVKE